MRNILSNLTAALLALHTVLGCCWHHEHRGTGACNLAAAAESPCHCDGDRSPCDGPTASSPGHQHHGLHACQGTSCSFLGQTKQTAHDSFWQVQAAPVLFGDTAILPAARGQFFARDALLSSPRLHLVYQVLLI